MSEHPQRFTTRRARENFHALRVGMQNYRNDLEGYQENLMKVCAENNISPALQERLKKHFANCLEAGPVVEKAFYDLQSLMDHVAEVGYELDKQHKAQNPGLGQGD